MHFNYNALNRSMMIKTDDDIFKITMSIHTHKIGDRLAAAVAIDLVVTAKERRHLAHKHTRSDCVSTLCTYLHF